jgi:hypothetical protein
MPRRWPAPALPGPAVAATVAPCRSHCSSHSVPHASLTILPTPRLQAEQAPRSPREAITRLVVLLSEKVIIVEHIGEDAS